MYVKVALVGAILSASTVPALAAEFYVVHDTNAKKCLVVEQRPTVETIVVVGDVAYATKQEAEAAIKTIAVCKS